MENKSWEFTEYDGRRIVFALGGLYVAAAIGWRFMSIAENVLLNQSLTISTLIGVPGFVLLYGGYRLPRTEVRPVFFQTIAKWCLGSIGVMLGVLLFIALAADITSVVVNTLILTALASVAGLGMGFHDARAKTRALNAEERRQEAERYGQELRRYESIVETVNEGILAVDENSHFTLVNEAYAEMVGYDQEELLGSHISHVIENETKTVIDEIQRDLTTDDTEAKTYEAVLETASGKRIEAEATVAGLPDKEGAEHDHVGVVRDVTERNERERQLEQQNKRLDSFASMVAHELRNPLMIGQMYCRELPADANPIAVDYIVEAFDRIEDIIDVMLVITQGYEAVLESSPVELADVAHDAWIKADAPDATLEVRVDDTIQADETYVQHLFRNLFENAVEHDGNDVTITVGELPVGFYVADNGVGIPADDRETIFETGYTTASSHGGMGLGLAFVKELTNVYGWKCTVTESNTGGARFEFTNIETHNVVE